MSLLGLHDSLQLWLLLFAGDSTLRLSEVALPLKCLGGLLDPGLLLDGQVPAMVRSTYYQLWLVL